MKSTGVTRKIDDLGRIVIPKEIRKNLGIRDGETLEIFTEEDTIILKKHSLINRCEDVSKKLVEIINSIYDFNVIITDRNKIIAKSNNENIVNKKLNKLLIDLIDNRKASIQNKIILDDIELSGYFTIYPIISESDSLGLVIIQSQDNKNYEKIAKLIARIIADKINIY